MLLVGLFGRFFLNGAVARDNTADRPCLGVLLMLLGVGGLLDVVEEEYIEKMELRLDDMGFSDRMGWNMPN